MLCVLCVLCGGAFRFDVGLAGAVRGVVGLERGTIPLAEQPCAFAHCQPRVSDCHVERSETSGLDVPSQILRKLRMTVLAARQ